MNLPLWILPALALLFQEAAGAPPEPKAGGWMKRHEGFVEEARKGGFDVLFLGDSITDGWRSGAQKKMFDAAFGPLKAANFGIPADRTQHVLWRIANGEFEGLTLPRVVVLLIGTNDLGQTNVPRESVGAAVAGIEAILKEIHKRSPTTKILLLGIFPRGEKPDHPLRAAVKEANERLAAFDDEGKTVKFLDIGSRFLEADGTISRDTMSDFFHLTPRAYQTWAEAIKEPLTELLK
jgi:lysophospholipase L1-like esterase